MWLQRVNLGLIEADLRAVSQGTSYHLTWHELPPQWSETCISGVFPREWDRPH